MLEAWIQPAASTTRLPDRTRSGADAAHGRGGWSAARLKNGGKGSAHATVMERNINSRVIDMICRCLWLQRSYLNVYTIEMAGGPRSTGPADL